MFFSADSYAVKIQEKPLKVLFHIIIAFCLFTQFLQQCKDSRSMLLFKLISG